MSGFQTAYRPRPVFNQRPPMPIVPIERCRPVFVIEAHVPEPEPEPVKVDRVDPVDREAWEAASKAEAFSSANKAKAIIKDVADECGVTVDDILGQSRRAHIALARHLAMAAIHLANPHWSSTRIGELFGGRDHTTILHGINRIKAAEERVLKLWRSRYDTAEISRQTKLPESHVSRVIAAKQDLAYDEREAA